MSSASEHNDEAVDSAAAALEGLDLDARRLAASLEHKLFGRPPRTTVGRFLLIDKIGEGGMGAVYRAYDPELDRSVAVKVVRTRPTDAHDRRSQDLLVREARASARVTHPNVVTVYEVGSIDERAFIAMEYVPGTTLRSWLAQHSRSWFEVLRMFLQAARGLAAAHAAGLVHRDFKPDNVLIGEDGRARVADFGLARITGGPTPVDGMQMSPATGRREGTLSTIGGGVAVGTPVYMSPEQHRGEPATAQSDQFSLCVALYEALYGELPFDGNSLTTLRTSVQAGELRGSPSGVPRAVQAAVIRGLEPDAARRYPTLEMLIRALEPYAVDPAVRRRRIAAMALAVGGGVAGIAYGLIDDDAPAVAACDGGPQRLAELFAESDRLAIGEAFAALSTPALTSGSARVIDALDDYVTRWGEADTTTCSLKTSGLPDADVRFALRRLCLDRGRDRFGALVDVLAQADDDVALKAVDAIRSLPSPDACLDDEQLARVAVAAPPAAIAGRVAQLRRDIEEAVALRTAGRVPRARDLAQRVADEADTLEYPPLQAEAYARLGAAQTEMGQLDDARATLERGLWLAEASGHDAMKADILLELVAAVGVRLSERTAGRKWAEQAEATLARIGNPASEVTKLSLIRATMHFRDDDYVRARELAEKSLEGVSALHGADSAETIGAVLLLGSIQAQSGERNAARADYTRARALIEQHYGRVHPIYAAVLQNIGLLDRMERNHAAAIELYREALDILVTVYGKDHPRVASLRGVLGISLGAIGRSEEALVEHQQSLEVFSASLGANSPFLGKTHAYIGLELERLKRLPEALAAYDRAVEIYQAAPDAPAIGYAAALAGRARVLSHLSRFGEALTTLDRAIAILDERAPTRPELAALKARRPEIIAHDTSQWPPGYGS